MTIDNSAVETNDTAVSNSEVGNASMLATAEQADVNAEATNPETTYTFPEKYLKDGQPDYDALTKGYHELSDMMRRTRPTAAKSVDEYSVEGLEIPFDEERLGEVKTRLLDMGLSSEQFKNLMPLYQEEMERLAGQVMDTPEKAESELKEAWGDSFEANLKDAFRAFKTYAPQDVDINAIGNNPHVLKLLSAIGKELSEDSTPSKTKQDTGAVSMSEDEINELRNRDDYWINEEVQKKVQSYYKAKFGD
jgi:hypothetical protein